jgi:hypothetical protein
MTNDRLTLAQVVLLGTYAVGMAAGQVLFKLAAQRFPASAAVGKQLTSFLGNTYFFRRLCVLFARLPSAGFGF